MKKIVLYFVISLSGIGFAKAQQDYKGTMKSFKLPDVVCPAGDHDHFSIIQAPEGALSKKGSRVTEEKKSQFIVTYIDFPADAKAAFQRAVDIWEHLIYSNVPIRVTANWRVLGTNILGSANASDFLMNFEGAKYRDTYYPISLAEKLAGKPLNSDATADIVCNFNSSVTWHYGEPEDIKSGYYDLTSTVLHELGHGLGFISSMSVSGRTGYYGGGSNLKTIYDVFIEDAAEKRLVNTEFYKNSSSEIYSALTGMDLYFDQGSNAVRPKLYAPSSYIVGSSISHLDDYSYASGTENSLMTSSARSMEVTHHPGPLALNMFYDMGWKSSSIAHKQLKNLVEGGSVAFTAEVLSDVKIVENSVKLYVSVDAGDFTEEVLQNLNGSNVYTTSVPLTNTPKTIRYYFEAEDSNGNIVRAPGENAITSENYYYSFKIGPDETGPQVIHSPFKIEPVNSSYVLMAYVDDDYADAIKDVVVRYQVNGGAIQNTTLTKYNETEFDPSVFGGSGSEFLYLNLQGFQGLRLGDQIKYQIVSTDKSGNVTVLPTEYTSTNYADKPSDSFYEFTVTSLLGPIGSYKADFDLSGSASDFAMTGFRVTQESGFNSTGLHTSHPYKNGLGLLVPGTTESTLVPFEREEIAMLRHPVLIGLGKNTTISFDEVVLIEPSEEGATYGGDGFYDYAVVEGSYDAEEWFPLEDGYDSRDQSLWLDLYNSSSSGGDLSNSTAKGSGVYTKKRTVLINPGVFNSMVGRQLFLRFRLYSDQWTNGWGWSIDNLLIQEEAAVVLGNEENQNLGLKIYPNPSSDKLLLSTTLSSLEPVEIEVFSLLGSKVLTETVKPGDLDFKHLIRIDALTVGNYVVRLKDAKGVLIKRFVKI